MTEAELERFAAVSPDLVAYTRHLRALLDQAYEFIELGRQGTVPVDVQWEVYSTRWESLQTRRGSADVPAG